MFNRRDSLKLFAFACGLTSGCTTEEPLRKNRTMTFRTIKVSGAEAVSTLTEYRSRFPSSGEYPFLIGDGEELSQIEGAAKFNEQDPLEIVEASLSVRLDNWISDRRMELTEYGFSVDDVLGEWPGEVTAKDAIGLHKDVLTGKIKQEVFIGLAAVDHAWQLPAVLKYGAWNDCPEAEVHCAFHREWHAKYGAQISGVSGDVIECVVDNPPSDQATALELAWQQYWYCADIVDQGCVSINNLAATLINSHYWFFWWD